MSIASSLYSIDIKITGSWFGWNGGIQIVAYKLSVDERTCKIKTPDELEVEGGCSLVSIPKAPM